MNGVSEYWGREKDEEEHGDLLETWHQDRWSFRKWMMREDWIRQRVREEAPFQCVDWFFLYRVKLCNQIRTYLKGKIANKEKTLTMQVIFYFLTKRRNFET